MVGTGIPLPVCKENDYLLYFLNTRKKSLKFGGCTVYLVLSHVFLGGPLLLFIFGCAGPSFAVRGRFLVVASGGYSLLQSMGFSLPCLLWCSAQALGLGGASVVAA